MLREGAAKRPSQWISHCFYSLFSHLYLRERAQYGWRYMAFTAASLASGQGVMTLVQPNLVTKLDIVRILNYLSAIQVIRMSSTHVASLEKLVGLPDLQ